MITKKEFKKLEEEVIKLKRENWNREEEMYNFYLERRLDEINAKLKNKITYTYEQDTFNANNTYPIFSKSILIIKMGNKIIKNIKIPFSLFRRTDHKEILEFLNSTSLKYFIKLDKKLTQAEVEVEELTKKESERFNISEPDEIHTIKPKSELEFYKDILKRILNGEDVLKKITLNQIRGIYNLKSIK